MHKCEASRSSATMSRHNCDTLSITQNQIFISRTMRCYCISFKTWQNVNMNLLLLGLTLGTIGKLVLGIAVLRVHVYIIREHKIDNVVIRALKREQIVTLVGLAFIVIGYVLEILFYSGSTDLLNCIGGECAGAVQSALNN
jgi:hypothetical protein